MDGITSLFPSSVGGTLILSFHDRIGAIRSSTNRKTNKQPQPPALPAEFHCHQPALFPGPGPARLHPVPAEQGKHRGCGENGVNARTVSVERPTHGHGVVRG